jgi:hypothetical protein
VNYVVKIMLGMPADRPLKVLTPDLAERLTAVNAAWRLLVPAGYRPINQDLRLGSNKRPLLFLPHGDEALRNRLREIAVLIDTEDGTRAVVGRLLDVDVRFPLTLH